MFVRVDPVTGGFNADNLDFLLIEKGMEQAHGVRSAADAGKQGVGKASFLGHDLAARFLADHALKIAD